MALLGQEPEYRPTTMEQFATWVEDCIFSEWFLPAFLLFIIVSIFAVGYYMAHRAGL